MTQHHEPPTISELINRQGFRPWHEYELARAFGYLGLGVLALVAGLTIMEGAFNNPSWSTRWFNAFLSFFCLVGAGWAWLRFVKILILAESLSQQSVCGACQRYGQIRILEDQFDAASGEHHMIGQCKKCSHSWPITYTVQSRNARL